MAKPIKQLRDLIGPFAVVSDVWLENGKTWAVCVIEGESKKFVYDDGEWKYVGEHKS